MHTPHSVLHQEFGGDFDAYAVTLLTSAVARRIAAIGVTDYFSVEGYRQLRARLADRDWMAGHLDSPTAQAAGQLLIVANVELRSTPIQVNGTDSRVNMHVLFSDQYSADDIQDYFLDRLTFTAASLPGRPDEEWPLTMRHLEDLGAELKREHQPFTGSDLEVGMVNAVVSHQAVSSVLTSQAARFKNGYLLVVPIDEDLSAISWDGQGHLTRKLFIEKAHMLFSANAGTRAFGLGQRHPSAEDFKREFHSLKPCIHGSDAHSYETLFEPTDARYTWIKADPTWRGLRQLLNEPEHRVFIGAQPPELTERPYRLAKVIDSVEIRKLTASGSPQTWFDCRIPLNAGLCAVIGNRGSGKSALADIIGLAGSTRRVDSFSFLTEERFRHARTGSAGSYAATLHWLDGTHDGPSILSHNPDTSSVEKVRYIAQGYLEEICNEVKEGRDSRFYAELQDVIFSHVPPNDRQGFETLEDLLDRLGEGAGERIRELQEELRQGNADIVQVNRRLRPAFRQALEARLAEARRLLEAHDQAEPPIAAKPEPVVDEAEVAPLVLELDAVRAELATADDLLRGLQTEDASLALRVAAADRLDERVRTLESTVARRISEMGEDASLVEVQIDQVISFRVNIVPLTEARALIVARRQEIATLVDPSIEGSPAGRRAAALTRIAELEDQLSLPERQYQESVRRHEEWAERRAALLGDRTAPGTVEHYVAQLSALADLPEMLDDLRTRRADLVAQIHGVKDQLRVQYERYHQPVSDFLSTDNAALTEAFKLHFSATIADQGFVERLLAFVNQRKSGPFSGLAQGSQKLASMVAAVDWDEAASVVEFLDRLVGLFDDGSGGNRVADQLVQGRTEEQLLDFIYGLDFLAPVYRLTWDGRTVDELSPGERGNLLLIFYLLVDQSDIPLVIDQPEENLDNQTVVGTLVPGTRYARTRRQVIVVTHNPNLAVVCDADQVIYAHMDKSGGHAVTYISGAIEDPGINRKLVDVLEGTMPAFDQRAAKYIEHESR